MNWDEYLPNIFTDKRFRKTSRRKYQFALNGAAIGIVVAWKPVDYDNYALNEEDMVKLLYLKQEKQFDAVFVVLATINGNIAEYVGHRAASEVNETLKSVPPRDGPHGKYWLLRQDFLALDYQDSLIPF